MTHITRSALSSVRWRNKVVRMRYAFVEGGSRTVQANRSRHYHPRGPSFRFMLPTVSSLDRIVGRMHPSLGLGFPRTRESPRPHASSCPPFSPWFSPFSFCPIPVSLPSLLLLSFCFSPFSSCPFYPSGSLPSIHSLLSLSPWSSKGWPTPLEREREGVSSLPFVSIVHRRASRGFARAPSSARSLDP